MRSSVFSFMSLLFASAGASLYPTKPIAKTVMRGGTWNNITWIDSEREPHLDKLGRMRIDLWAEDIHYLDNLAKNVNPQQMSQKVFIPNDIWSDGSNFVIRFESSEPRMTIYTADFSITDMIGNRTARLDEKFRSRDRTGSYTPTSTEPSPSSTLGSGYNDLVTVTMMMSDASSAPSPTSTTAARVAAMANDASSGGRHVRRPNMQFNFVFVLFPALFGLALAL